MGSARFRLGSHPVSWAMPGMGAENVFTRKCLKLCHQSRWGGQPEQSRQWPVGRMSSPLPGQRCSWKDVPGLSPSFQTCQSASEWAVNIQGFVYSQARLTKCFLQAKQLFSDVFSMRTPTLVSPAGESPKPVPNPP